MSGTLTNDLVNALIADMNGMQCILQPPLTGIGIITLTVNSNIDTTQFTTATTPLEIMTPIAGEIIRIARAGIVNVKATTSTAGGSGETVINEIN
jgi:hypothetical protein